MNRWNCCWDYVELVERRNWLLWRNTQFQEDLRKLQEETGTQFTDTIEMGHAEDGKEVTRRIQTMNMLRPFAMEAFLSLPLGRKFLARYKIPHFGIDESLQTATEVEAAFDLLLDLAYLKGLAERDGWGFDAGNFERDRRWYELHLEWQNKDAESRTRYAEGFVDSEAYTQGRKLTANQRAKQVDQLLAKKRLPTKYVVAWSERNMPQEIDRMVLNSMRRSHDELLREIKLFAGKQPLDDRSKKLRDYEELYLLGVFLKARANKAWLRSQEVWPAYSMDGKPIEAGSEFYFRFDYEASLVKGKDKWFTVLESQVDQKTRNLREEFLQRRKDYLSKSDSNFANAVDEAFKALRRKIASVIDFR
ncbi:hypothetical protein HUU05_04675 [candidate division KSB1 bacterium]|nr:hypothetical protein [candidate division KSB1 bacterium]